MKTLFQRHGAKRLLRLAGILDVADAEHKRRGEPAYYQEAWQHPCGAPACALGHWAAHNRRRGWALGEGKDSLGGITWNGERVTCCSEHPRNEFGITEAEGNLLFSFTGCGGAKTAKQAARYIRKFVARKLKESARAASNP